MSKLSPNQVIHMFKLHSKLATKITGPSVAVKVLVLAGALAVVLAACSSNDQTTTPGTQGQQPAARANQQAQATTAPLPTRVVITTTSVSVDGVLALSVPTTTLGFEQTGKVVSVSVTAGQTVKKGDLLARIDDTSLKDAVTDAELQLNLVEAQIKTQASTTTKEELAAARASLAAATTNYNKTKAGTVQSDIDIAKRSLDAAWLGYLGAQSSRDTHCGTADGTDAQECKLEEANYGNAFEGWVGALDSYKKVLEPVSENTLTQAAASVISARAKITSLNTTVTEQAKKLAETQYSQAKSALERARNNLNKTRLLSPCDCIVQQVNVAEGVPAPSAAFALVDLTNLQFRTTNLGESDVAQIKTGAAVTIRLKSYENTFSGRVNTVLAQSSGTQSGSALFTALIDMDPTDQMLLPGMTGQAEISVK